MVAERREALEKWCDALMLESRHLGPAAWGVLLRFLRDGATPATGSARALSSGRLDARPPAGAYPEQVSAAFERIFPMLPHQITIRWLQKSGGGPLYEGWLWKEGSNTGIKAWNRRYFMLWPKTAHPQMGRLLAYFKDDSAPPDDDTARPTDRAVLKGVIHIATPVVRRPKTARPEYFCMRLNANTITGTSGVGVSLSNLLTTKMKYIIGDMSPQLCSRRVGGAHDDTALSRRDQAARRPLLRPGARQRPGPDGAVDREAAAVRPAHRRRRRLQEPLTAGLDAHGESNVLPETASARS